MAIGFGGVSMGATSPYCPVLPSCYTTLMRPSQAAMGVGFLSLSTTAVDVEDEAMRGDARAIAEAQLRCEERCQAPTRRGCCSAHRYCPSNAIHETSASSLHQRQWKMHAKRLSLLMLCR